MAALKILYVDDDDDIREVAALSLEMDHEIEVRCVPSGADALNLLDAEEWRADVLVLDVMMPQMDGPTLLEAVRSREALKATPAIFITARVLPGDRERLMALGAVGVITKPFDPLKLAGEVREILQRA